jgi:hypothetical protein
MQSLIQVCRGWIFTLVTEPLTRTKSGPTGQCSVDSLCYLFLVVSTLSFLVPRCFFLSNLYNPCRCQSRGQQADEHMQPPTIAQVGGNDRFVISPHPRGVTRKQSHGGEGSSSHANEEAARITRGHAVVVAREARASDII